MDQLTLLGKLDRVANVMRVCGLHSITRFGRHLVGGLLRGDLCVSMEGLLIIGSIEHRGYLLPLLHNRWEAFMFDLFKRVIKPGMFVLDIGAFLGQYSLLAARQVRPHGKVYAFEPDPLNYSFLVRNVERNGLGDCLFPIHKAVSDRSGQAPFFLRVSDHSQSSLYDSRGEVGKIVVESIDLDDWFGDAVAVDVIKMDIEGGELHALQGMERTLARAGSKLTMFVECNPSALHAAGGSAVTLVDRLRALGFTVMIIDEQSRCLSPVSAGIESVKYVNLYCSRSKEAI